MDLLEKALSLALQALEGRKGENGEPVILHSLSVGLMGNTDEERIVGFLHDAFCGSDVREETLKQWGFPDSIVQAVKLLSVSPYTSLEEQVRSIVASGNPIAIRVKANDLERHLAEGPLHGEKRADYERSLAYLTAVLKARTAIRPYDPQEAQAAGLEVAIFAAGCFWGVQHYFERQQGVRNTYAGYTGGMEEYPTYEDVRQHRTGHLEAVLVEYDPREVSYRQLAQLFFEIHDPSQTDGQGPDIGPQYLSGIFFTGEGQRVVAEDLIQTLRQRGYVVNTRLALAGPFWIAEEYHQHYYEHTGGSPYCHVRQRKF